MALPLPHMFYVVVFRENIYAKYFHFKLYLELRVLVCNFLLWSFKGGGSHCGL